jgi:3-ketosteroid 9alpha-monooxygenase subunit A
MVDRFEFELDTTQPTAAWMKEVEANIAARASAAGPVG